MSKADNKAECRVLAAVEIEIHTESWDQIYGGEKKRVNCDSTFLRKGKAYYYISKETSGWVK